MILVQGYNQDIAKAFFQNCICNTTAASTARTIVQNYTTHANQILTCNIVAPTQIPVYINVYFNQVLSQELQGQIKDEIMTIARYLTTGQELTSAMILETLGDFKAYGLLGATAGKSSDTQSYKVTPQVDELFVFNTANIYIESQGV